MSVDTTAQLLFFIIGPLCLLIIVLGWIIYMSRSRRPLNVQLRGLGLSISVDTRPAAK